MADAIQPTISAARKPPLTQERLKELLHYDPETGEFTWLRGKRAGKKTGLRSPKSQYCRIHILSEPQFVHRLAWLYMTGKWPDHFIDHIDTNKFNNRWSNLRRATKAQNTNNRGLSKRNTSGFKGATFDKRRRLWLAQIVCQSRHYHLGRFRTAEEAHAAYVAKAKEFHGEFARTA